MKPQDLKIRFSCEKAESWLRFWSLHFDDIDWDSLEPGIRNFQVMSVKEMSGNQMAYYRTKTQRVVYISAKEPFVK